MALGMLRQFLEWRDAGEKTPAQLLEICLARIAEREPKIQAWVQVAPQPATCAGPLAGIPFGAKDIYETQGLITAYGSPLYAGRIGSADAALVAQLRGLGAVLLGKTQTTAFAYFDPAPTRNPRDLTRTPGGSSSGSAAAVAAGMVPFALGSQTQGSVLRPASFCGVAGFKPTRGLPAARGRFALCAVARYRGIVHANRGRHAAVVELHGISHAGDCKPRTRCACADSRRRSRHGESVSRRAGPASQQRLDGGRYRSCPRDSRNCCPRHAW